jgi:aspartyl protease family protein
MPGHFIGLCLLLASASAFGAEVALIGVIGDKAAVLAVDGGDPKTVKVGQSWSGITVLSVGKDRAFVEIDGKRRTLQRGPHYRGSAPADRREAVTIAADPRGHFFADGTVNGSHVRFIVDTGATSVVLPGPDASRLGIDFKKGRLAMMSTANGPTPAYSVLLDRVRVGTIELANVEAQVVEQGLPIALLGMTFLNRVDMKREGGAMTLTRRF